MSVDMKKLAELLKVDQVQIFHGPKGYALKVRVEKSWQVDTVDRDTLEDSKKPMEIIADKLCRLADDLNKALGRGDLRKAVAQQEPERRRPGMLSWKDVGGWTPYESARQQQVQRVEPMPQRPPPAPSAPPAPVTSAPLPSRFHAIVEELKLL